jgi:outer membrane protein assembly factor BamD (BamD/ComL family)
MRRPTAFAALLAALAAAFTITPTAAAQEAWPVIEGDSTLEVAVRLATEGQADSARAYVRARLAETSPGDTLYPRVLYAAGVVAADVDSAMFYFRRVGIEFSRSSWADRAHLRLAQLAFASGDFAAAYRSSLRVIRDYPFSDVLAEANFWAGRSQLELGNPMEGCRLLNVAAAGASDDVELGNRARYQLQRCAAVQQAGDSAGADTTARPRTVTVYAAQVAAVQSVAAADELMRQLNAAGYEPHVVRDADGLFKVRVGRYPDRQQAQRVVNELRQRLGGSPFVVEEQQ